MPPPQWKRSQFDKNHYPQCEGIPSSTVTKSWARNPQERFLVNAERDAIRRITPAEVARIQGFPAGYFDDVPISDADKIGLAGNAVPPPLAMATFEALGRVMGGSRSTLELFAGAGGSALGATYAHYDVVGLVDLWDASCEILRRHFPPSRVLCESVDTVNLARFRGVDVLSGGPPCQPFAKGSRRLGADDPRDRCVALPPLLAELQPRAFLFEESDELYTHKGGDYWAKLAARLHAPVPGLEYSIAAVLLQAHDYGVPQRRYRAFVAGFRNADPRRWVETVLSFARPGAGGPIDQALDDAAAEAAGEVWGAWEYGCRRPQPLPGRNRSRAVAVWR